MVYNGCRMNRLQTFLSGTPLTQRLCILAVLLMLGFTVVQEITFSNRPLQIRELSGREVGTDKMVEVFLRMDELALRQHYLFVWTVNGVIFLSALLAFRVFAGVNRK